MSDAARPARRGLPQERTELAWRRTGLAVTAASAIAGKSLEPVLGSGAFAVGAAGIALAVLLVLGSAARARRERTAVRTGEAGPGGWFLAAVSVACVALGIAALVLVVVVGVAGSACGPLSSERSPSARTCPP
jgi:uncharacterized membrane protein YidH (DUF202 family)